MPGAVSTLPKSDMEVLSQEIDESEGFYRIRAGNRVYHLNILAGVYDRDTMRKPFLLIPALPDFPDGEWTEMQVVGVADGKITTTVSYDRLPEIEAIWHTNKIDILALGKLEKYYREGVWEVQFQARPAILKFARWGWEIPRIENETWFYSIIDTFQNSSNYKEPPIAPKFLGHVTENGRVMGFLLEKVEGRYANPEDEAVCEEAVRRIHAMGFIHGDINRYNFLINDSTGRVCMIDFDYIEGYDEEKGRRELQSLPAELAENTGRGQALSL